MADHNELGEAGEEMAVDYLVKKGFHLRDRNWTFKKGEIDIVVETNDRIVFVEVKTRNTRYFGGAAEAVTPAKQRKVIKTAHQYILEHDLNKEARFDIVFAIINSKEQSIEHIPEAFIPQW